MKKLLTAIALSLFACGGKPQQLPPTSPPVVSAEKFKVVKGPNWSFKVPSSYKNISKDGRHTYASPRNDVVITYDVDALSGPLDEYVLASLSAAKEMYPGTEVLTVKEGEISGHHSLVALLAKGELVLINFFVENDKEVHLFMCGGSMSVQNPKTIVSKCVDVAKTLEIK